MKFLADKHALFVQGSQPEFEGNGDPYTHRYFPARWATLAALLPHSTIVLPDQSEVRDLVDFLESTLTAFFRRQMEVCWVSGNDFLLDNDIAAEARGKLRSIVDTHSQAGRTTVVFPYRRNKYFTDWSSSLFDDPHAVIADDPVFIERFGGKDILYPHLTDEKSAGVFDQVAVRLPRGFVCSSKVELVDAYRRLEEAGITKVVIKPVKSAAGLGIVKASSLSEVQAYEWHLGGAFVIEECLAVDTDADGNELSCSVQFIGTELVGGPKSQLVDGTHWIGNVSPSLFSEEFAADVVSQTRQALERLHALGLRGPGGFDFLSCKGRPYLVDPNVGRFTGAHCPEFIAQNLFPGKPWALLDMPKEKSIFEVWEILNRNGLALDFAAQQGVFPFCHLPKMWSMALAFGDTNQQALAMIQKARRILHEAA